MTESKEKMMKIVVSENGPYVVSGQVPLSIQVITSNKDGFSWDWTEGKKFQTDKSGYSLCRCGRARTTPFLRRHPLED